ncbi:hypothetical protein FACS1894161_4650 [Spirochaetia bacterium]|nr:hypothetical protein FACS1894161_4650 [Spirochaetia bacterium]
MSKFTRSRIAEILQSGAALEMPQAQKLAGRIIEAMTAALVAGEVIELRGLGTLETRERKGRMAHNPKTLAPVAVPPRRRVVFRPGSELKAALRGTAPRGRVEKLEGRQ